MKGGKLIGSGSYGCIFNPPLKCKNSVKKNMNRKNNTKKLISKLSLKHEALDEYDFNIEILNRLKKDKTFKNKKKYFLFTKEWCLPKKLKLKDERELINKCDNMVGKEYKENKLTNLALLNMEYGGMNLDKYIILSIINNKENKINFINKLVTLLINIINNGISLLHKRNIYHTDIKSLNILVSEDESHLYLIDWGLTILDLPNINDSIYKGIHFNRPYESLLFNINHNEKIDNIDVLLDNIIINNIDKINRSGIKNDIDILFNNTNKENSINILKKYLLFIVNKISGGNKFNRQELINNYYVKQDYWGLITILMDLYKYFNLSNSDYEDDFRNIFKYFLSNLRIDKRVLIGLFKKLKRE